VFLGQQLTLPPKLEWVTWERRWNPRSNNEQCFNTHEELDILDGNALQQLANRRRRQQHNEQAMERHQWRKTTTTPHSKPHECPGEDKGRDSQIFTILNNVFSTKRKTFGPNTTRMNANKKWKTKLKNNTYDVSKWVSKWVKNELKYHFLNFSNDVRKYFILI